MVAIHHHGASLRATTSLRRINVELIAALVLNLAIWSVILRTVARS